MHSRVESPNIHVVVTMQAIRIIVESISLPKSEDHRDFYFPLLFECIFLKRTTCCLGHSLNLWSYALVLYNAKEYAYQVYCESYNLEYEYVYQTFQIPMVYEQ